MKITYIKSDNPWGVIEKLREETSKILLIAERVFDFSIDVPEDDADKLLIYTSKLPESYLEAIKSLGWSLPYVKLASSYSYILFDFTKQQIPPDFYTHMEYAELLDVDKHEVIVLCGFNENVPGDVPSALSEISKDNLDYMPCKEVEYLDYLPKLFSKEARDAGIKLPKGSLLVGVPGTGKTLAAQHCAQLLNRPLYQLNLHALYNKLVGESEKALHLALQYVANNECVFFIDEVDKIFTFDAANSLQQKILSMVLTWLSSDDNKCYTIMAANRAANIPVELLRKGRIDKILHITPPNEEDIQLFLDKYGKGLPFTAKDFIGYTQAEIVWACNLHKEKAFLGLPLVNNYIPMSIKLPHILEEIKNWAELYAD